MSLADLVNVIEATHPGTVVSCPLPKVIENPQIYHFSVFGGVHNESDSTDLSEESVLSGHGDSLHAETALLKAYSEFIERRILCRRSREPTSNGFAVSLNPEHALGASCAEALERDVCLSLWFSGRSPLWLTSEELAALLPEEWKQISEEFDRWGVHMRIGLVARLEQHLVGISVCTGLQATFGSFGAIFGSACALSMSDLLTKLCVGQARNLAWLKISSETEGKDSFTKSQKRSDEVTSIKDHRKFFLDPNHWDYFAHFLETGAGIYQLHLPSFVSEPLDVGELTAWPLFAFRSAVSQGQGLFFGAASPEKIMSARLQLFNPVFDVSRVPIHPFV